jgi:hypothetical protein
MLTSLAAAQDPSNESGVKPTSAPEYKIKAGYLSQLMLFVHWPDRLDEVSEPSTNQTICIIGRDRFADAFQDIEDKPWGSAGRILRIRRLGRFKPTTDLGGCHILFVSDSEEERCAEILLALEDAPTLTVADMDGFLEQGGIVQFVIQGDNVRWKINLTPAERTELEIDSQILELAIEVGRISPRESASSNRPGGMWPQ